MALLTLADAKNQLNVTGSSLDAELQTYVDAVSAVVQSQQFIGQVDPVAVTEVVDITDSMTVFVSTRPVMSMTTMTSLYDNSTFDVTKLYIRSASGGMFRCKPMSWIYPYGPWTVVYQAGRSSVPPQYNTAARIIVQHLWDTQRGTAGGPRVGGEETTMVPGFGFALPNRALDMLVPRIPATVG